MGDDNRGTSDLEAIDEILEVMFWMQGEALATRVSARDLLRFVAIDGADLSRLLETLTRRGWIARDETDEPSQYSLTDVGRHEAGRRFADEFAEMTKPGHGECGDPDCECHQTGSPEDCRHRHTI
jgi:hypothetical protein